MTRLLVVQGMLLDCDAATLTVWVNGERKGVMVRPGMTDNNGELVGRLEGPLRWVVDVQTSSEDHRRSVGCPRLRTAATRRSLWAGLPGQTA